MIIGLTGPMGAGKSEVAKLLKRRGFLVIEADELAHKLYAPQSPVWCEVVKAFGSRILNRGGVINRAKLGKIVFTDKKKLEKLNSIVHPKLKEEIKKSIVESGNPKVAINAALPQLFEDLADKVWVVVASREKRLRRLIRGGLTKSEAVRRMRAQMSQAEYLKRADVVIKNEGTLKQLNVQVQANLKL
jgi:dephospho-CoA kinase